MVRKQGKNSIYLENIYRDIQIYDMRFLTYSMAGFTCPKRTDRTLNVSSKNISVFYLNSMKFNEVLVHIDNYNFTNFSLNSNEKNKSVFNDTFNGQSVC